MSGMTHVNLYTTISGRLMKWPRLCALLGLLLARAALGTDPLYQNDGFVDYEGAQGTYPPAIDATSFVNNGTFTINWSVIAESTASLNNYLYETWNTVNFTNSRLMDSNIGFVFDTQTYDVNPRQMAGTFYNPGEVECAYGFSAWATNIVNPGAVDVPGTTVIVDRPDASTIVSAQGGFMQFTGQNVDLTGSTLSILGGQGIAQAVGLLGLIGQDTNSDWDATVDLGPTYAYPSIPVINLLPPNQGGLGFPNIPLHTTPYFNAYGVGTNTVVYQVVFLQDTSPNVSHNVYFDDAGDSYVEWVGPYVDPATGIAATNYLYLVNNYLQSVATNDPNINGIPFNFKLIENQTPFFLGTPTAAGFYNVFLPGFVSNRFAYVSAQLVATTAATNSIPNHSITNLPARIQISASRELNLAQAQITQPDYLSLWSTNQFDGNAGCRIAAPYTDLNLGVTNGFLTISNLQPQSFPVWAGPVQAWSTRWFVLVTNTLDGTNFFNVTNDYQVEIVASQLSPTTPGQMRDFLLHSTNSVTISDAFNVMRTLFIDARSLTLTTNIYGGGARSADGELNLESANILWPSSLPNLLWLTNNGAISTLNLANFGSPAPTYTTNTTPAIAAAAVLSETVTNGNVPATNTITIGTYNYVFVNTITNTAPNQVKIAATFDGSMSNLIAAINHRDGSGTNYSTNTTMNTLVTAGLLTGHSFAVTATTNGSSGNLIATISSTTNLTWNGLLSTNLSGGVDAATNVVMTGGPYGAFVNRGRVRNLGGCLLWAQDFENYGTFFAGNSGFNAQTLATTMTNGSIVSFGSLTINSDSLVASNSVLNAGAALNLTATNLLTDTGVTSGNYWQVGSQQPPSASPGSYFINGFNLPVKPAAGDLLGTTVTSTAPSQVVLGGVTNFTVTINNLWAGADKGVSNAGYTNNAAVGHLVLDAQGKNGAFKFYGAGASNAIYVDRLELRDYASYTNHNAGGNLPALAFNTNYVSQLVTNSVGVYSNDVPPTLLYTTNVVSTNLVSTNNLVIYYADAVAAGAGLGGQPGDVSELINHKNNDHLRWVPTYAGYFSATNLVFAGVTNTVNIALAESHDIDSDGDGIANASDPTPFFLPSMVNLVWYSTNNPPGTTAISWDTVPLATNYVYYSTNVVLTSNMVNLNVYSTNNPANTMIISWNTVSLATNIVNYTTNLMSPITWTVLTNVISPQYPTAITNVMVFDPIVVPGRYYQVVVYQPMPTWQLFTNIYIPTNPFVTPAPYPGPVTNVMVFDPIPGRYYQVTVMPWLTYPY
jgi:hypothetical protein